MNVESAHEEEEEEEDEVEKYMTQPGQLDYPLFLLFNINNSFFRQLPGFILLSFIRSEEFIFTSASI